MKEPPSITPDRDLALHILMQVDTRKGRPEDFAEWSDASALSRELVLTTLRHRGSLRAWTDHLSQRPPQARVRPLIELGLTQLLLLDGIPDHAALHETLESGKRAGFKSGIIGFVNALLRRVGREKDTLETWMASQPLSTRFSHPDWLVSGWENAFGPEQTQKMCAWNQKRSATFVRSIPILPEKQQQESDLLTPVEGFPEFYRLIKGISPTRLPGFNAGTWYVQDPSTSVAPAMVNARPGERILDACAAPGGKTAILAEAVGQQGKGIVAADLKAKRIRRLRENMDRLGQSAVEIREGDIETWLKEDTGAFDAVLLDVPCSNTGVLQRRPDVKESLHPDQINQLCGLQRHIIDTAARLVRPGGRIVYSTCSIEPAETTEQIEGWLENHPDWRKGTETLLLPGERGCDGCYAVRLEQVAD